MASLEIFLSFKAINRARGLYLLWTLSLALALTGLAVVDVYRQSLSLMVQNQGRKMLAADVTLSARRVLSKSEISTFQKDLPTGTDFSALTEMTAMVTAHDESRLALVRFIDDPYPLVGDLRLQTQNDRELHGQDLNSGIWVAEDLLTLMNVKVGETLSVGDYQATIAGVLSKDSSQTLRFGGLAPRIYLHQKYLAATHLLQFGSTLSQTRLARLPKNFSLDSNWRRRIEKTLTDPALQISEPSDLEQGSLRILSRVLDFLGLIGLVTLILGWIGVYFLSRRWLMLEEPDAALLKCVGLSARELQNLLRTKLAIVLLSGTLLGGTLAWIAAQAVLPFLRESLPAEFVLRWSWETTFLLCAIGPVAGMVLLFEPIRALSLASAQMLLRAPTHRAIAWRAILILILLITFLFIGLTYIQARSWRVSFSFLGALLISTTGVIAVTYAGLSILRRLRAQIKSGWKRHVMSALWVNRMGTTLLLVTISALASLLAQLVPHLERTLVGDLRAPPKNARPAVFLYDVQDEQLVDLQKKLSDAKVTVSQASPFVRARILKVNGVGFERTQLGKWSSREDEVDARMRNRGINLTYREALSPSEKNFSGKEFSDLNANEVSVEAEYAKRLNLNLNDQLQLDVQGLEIEAKVASLRSVDWDSFQPNFFIEFRQSEQNPIAGAPKTWIMTLDKSPNLTPARVQRLVAKSFANISSINVEETLDNIVLLVGQLGAGLNVASRLTLALGTLVFLIVTLFQLSSAHEDWQQLRLLGASCFNIWQIQALSYGLLSLFGAILGTVLAIGVNYALAKFVLHAVPVTDLAHAAQTNLLTLGVALIGLTLFSRFRA